MGGSKERLDVGGVPMIERVAAVLREVCDEILVVGGDPAWPAPVGVRRIQDDEPGLGPLGGLSAGLAEAAHDPAVVVACDMPFLDPALLRFLLHLTGTVDAVVPRHAYGVEPLHAVYRRACLPCVRTALTRGIRRADGFHRWVRVRYVDRDQWGAIDPHGRSWMNVNTPDELEAARRLAGQTDTSST